MKKLFIILVAAGLAACNSGKNADGTSVTDNSDSSTAAAGVSDQNTTGAGGSDTGSAAITSASVDTSVSNFIQQAVMSNAMEVEASEVAQKKASSGDVKSYAGMMITDHGKALKKLQALAKKKRVELPVMTDANRNMGTAGSSAGQAEQDQAAKYGSQSRPGRDVTTHDEGKTGPPRGTEGTKMSNNGAASSGGSQSVGGDAGYVSHQEKLNRLKMRTGADFDRQYVKMMLEDHAKAIQLLEKGSRNTDADVKAFAGEMLPTIRIHERSAKALSAKVNSQK